MSYLPQQVFLIDNSLRCNVALGETESAIEESRLQEALRQARLSELVKQLPQGVNTWGARGASLAVNANGSLSPVPFIMGVASW